jgi:hypothetical protein
MTQVEFNILSATKLNENDVSDLKDAVITAFKKFHNTKDGGPKDNFGEGLLELADGSLHFYTYELRDDLVVEVIVFPRERAESILNPHGLSTYEFFD